MPGQPHLLAGSVLELRKMMVCYILFSDNIALGSVALLEGVFGSQTSVSRDALPNPSNVPSNEVATPIRGPLEESMLPQVLHERWVRMEAPPNQFPSWKKVLNPSWLVAAVEQAPPACEEMKRRHHHQSSEDSTPESRRAVAGRAGQMRFTFIQASGTNTHGCPTPRL